VFARVLTQALRTRVGYPSGLECMKIHVTVTDSGTSSMSVFIMYDIESYLLMFTNPVGHVPNEIGS
jgi:formylmethanofuran dehydrogenase subunit B